MIHGPADQARTYSSSQPTIIQNENLLLHRLLSTTLLLRSLRFFRARYSRYASLYPDNEQFQALTNQKVSATLPWQAKGARPVEEDLIQVSFVSVTLLGCRP